MFVLNKCRKTKCDCKIMSSYWETEFWHETYEYVIIGAGIVGLSTALEIRAKYPNASILILERGGIPQGASTKNAGFACFGTLTEIQDDLTSLSEQEAESLIRLRWNGLQRLLNRIGTSEMDYFNLGGEEVFLNEEEYNSNSQNLSNINRIIEQAIGISNVLEPRKQNKFPKLYSQSIFNQYESQLNPVKLIKALVKRCYQSKIEISFNCAAITIEPSSHDIEIGLQNNLKQIAKNVVITNNAFARQFFPDIDITPVRNQVIISKPIKNLPLKGTYHFDKGFVYFRNVENRVLIGGARNIDMVTETTDIFDTNHLIIEHLTQFAQNELSINEFEPEYNWSGIIASGSKKTSIIERADSNIYLAVRQGGMGVAIGSEVAFKVVELM